MNVNSNLMRTLLKTGNVVGIVSILFTIAAIIAASTMKDYRTVIIFTVLCLFSVGCVFFFKRTSNHE